MNMLLRNLWALHRQRNEASIREEFLRLCQLALDHHGSYYGRGDVSQQNADDAFGFAKDTERVNLWLDCWHQTKAERAESRRREEAERTERLGLVR